jgi:TonB family protein
MKIIIEYMDTQSNPSDDDIRSYMNFDKLVDDARKHSAGKRTHRWWIALPVALAVVSIGLVINNYVSDDSRGTESQAASGINALPDPLPDGGNEISSGTPMKVGGEKAITPEPSASGKADQEHDLSKTQANDMLSAPKEHSAQKKVDESSSDRDSGEGTGNVPKPASPATDLKGDAKDVYVQAEPREGYAHLYAYFNDNLRYPPQAIKDSIEGIETISFMIDKRGKATNFAITNSLGALFDQEAMRLIRNMPDWNPASLNGEPVASQLSVPLTFQLKRIKH